MTQYPDEQVLAAVTNRRQARRIRDVNDDAALYARIHDQRDLWVVGTDGGLYVVRYGPGGGLSMARHQEPAQVRAALRTAEEDGTVDVVHDRDDQPEAVRRATWGDGS